jgi:hypothetical protein
MSSKTQQQYDSAFEAVFNLRDDFHPERFLIDFERGVKNAIERNCPNIQVKGCNFHFGQCIWRQIQQLPEVLHRYSE